jgi:hypothetical protein
MDIYSNVKYSIKLMAHFNMQLSRVTTLKIFAYSQGIMELDPV